MMALPEVTPEDVDARYDGDLLSEFDATYIETQIGDAVDYVGSRWRARVEARLASGDLTVNLFKRVISDAVLRVARNPGGLASENEGGYGYSTRSSVASGNLWFTEDDILSLCGPLEGNFPGTIGIGLDRGWGG
jgi:hypothetical protein